MNEWSELLRLEMQKPYFKQLTSLLNNQYKNFNILPERRNIFKALSLTPYDAVKCVIVGQDPYPSPLDANGLAFSSITRIPKSLANIYYEVSTDLQIPSPSTGELYGWAEQGVLLLNSTLTVIAFQSGSHKNIGWEPFTNKIIQLLNERETPLVFLLWGNLAKEKHVFITNKKHLVLESSHPGPRSATRGFFGCRHFSKTNKFLKINNLSEIDWSLNIKTGGMVRMSVEMDPISKAVDITNNKHFDIAVYGNLATIITGSGMFKYTVTRDGDFYILESPNLTPLKIRVDAPKGINRILLWQNPNKEESEVQDKVYPRIEVGITQANTLAVFIGAARLVDEYNLESALIKLMNMLMELDAINHFQAIILSRLQILKAMYKEYSEASHELSTLEISKVLLSTIVDVTKSLVENIEERKYVTGSFSNIEVQNSEVTHYILFMENDKDLNVMAIRSIREDIETVDYLYYNEINFGVYADREAENEIGSSMVLGELHSLIKDLLFVDYSLAFEFVKAQIVEALSSSGWRWSEVINQEDQMDQYITGLLETIEG